MTNHCVTYRINYTARVDDDNVGNDVGGGDSRVARAIKPMSYRALIISTTRASDPRIPTKIYALCSIDYKEIIDPSPTPGGVSAAALQLRATVYIICRSLPRRTLSPSPPSCEVKVHAALCETKHEPFVALLF